MKLTVISSTADILGNPTEPHRISSNDSQLLYGEQFQVEESHGAYVYGHSLVDDYKGYVERGQLIKDAPEPTHLVTVKSSHIYPEPSFKSRPLTPVNFLSRVACTDKTEGDFTKTQYDEWIFTDHISPIKDFKMPDDLAKTTEMYLGAPYLYGGRSPDGIDCSAIIQQALIAHGHKCPRDTSQQKEKIGKAITDHQDIQRNDIIFLNDRIYNHDGEYVGMGVHVGIMLDDKNILNANVRHMSTVIEKLDDLKKIYDGITRIARI